MCFYSEEFSLSLGSLYFTTAFVEWSDSQGQRQVSPSAAWVLPLLAHKVGNSVFGKGFGIWFSFEYTRDSSIKGILLQPVK